MGRGKFKGKVEHVKWWSNGQYVSNGKEIFQVTSGNCYEKAEFHPIPKKYAVRIIRMSVNKLKVLNKYTIIPDETADQFRDQIKQVQKYSQLKEIQLFTDAGVNLETGEATYGIIITDGITEEEIICALPKVERTGATTAEALSVAAGLEILTKANFKGEVKAYNDNTKVIDTTNTTPNFKEAVGDHGWAISKIWSNSSKFEAVKGEWSKDDSNRSLNEHTWIQNIIQRCHNLAHGHMDSIYDNIDLSVSFEDAIECGKLGSTARKLIGLKYVNEYLQKKYNVGRSDIYLEERRKAILRSDKYVVKTVNGLNVHGEREKHRGNSSARYPVCQQQEN